MIYVNGNGPFKTWAALDRGVKAQEALEARNALPQGTEKEQRLAVLQIHALAKRHRKSNWKT